MNRPEKEFYPKPIVFSALSHSRPNRCALGEGVEVVVLARKDKVFIYRDLCPHMGASLADGWYDTARTSLQCPWHGYVYSADTGEFIKNPNDDSFACMKSLYATYKSDRQPKYRLSALAYEGDHGLIYVRRPQTT